MLSIPDTLSLHRRTRSIYMEAFKKARVRRAIFDNECWIAFHRQRWSDHLQAALKEEFHKNAMHCFLRHARAANHRLVAVKRFARQFETGKQNLLNSDDDSVWGD